MNPPSPFEADESMIVKRRKQTNNYIRKEKQEEIISSDFDDNIPQTD